MPSSTNRRTFLLAAGAAAAAYAASPPIRTAFIGVGNRGSSLLRQTLEQSDVAINAICDLDPGARDSAMSKAAEHKPRAYTDWREIADLKDVDAVKIATPCYLHAEMAAACLEAGKYVYCEKPLGITPEQVDLVLKASRQAKTFLQIGQQIRYFPGVREVVRRIREDKVAGEVFVIRAQRDGAPARPDSQRRPRPAWYEDPKKSGDLIVENSVHNLDVCNWLAGGRPVSAYGHGARYLPERLPAGKLMMDGFSVAYIYNNDIHLDYNQLYLHARGMKEVPNGQWYMIHGEKGSVFMTHSSAVFHDMQGEAEPLDLIPSELKDAKENAMSEFYACIREGRKPFADITVGATAALTGILGREAIYKGASVSWDELGVSL